MAATSDDRRPEVVERLPYSSTPSSYNFTGARQQVLTVSFQRSIGINK